MSKGKFFDKVEESTHCETGFSKLYTDTVLEMLIDAKESFPIGKRSLKILTEQMQRGKKIGKLYGFNTNEMVEWFIKNFVSDIPDKVLEAKSQ